MTNQKLEFDNYYFKNQSKEYPLMSGIRPPMDDDGVVRNKRFKNCSFHFNCQDIKFEDCEFVDCDRPWLY